jgi:plasmid stabilization system protein ParE
MIAYRFLRIAEQEMIDAANLYNEKANGLGSVFLDDVHHAISNIRKYPQLGADAGNTMQRAILTRFPYSVIYAVEPDSILIIAVAHHRRLPGYWKDRTD